MKNLNEEIGRIKSLMGILTEDTEDKIAVLIDGTSSAGKSMTAKLLNAVPFYKATDPNQWVVIDSDDFSGMGNDEEKRRLKLDHPNIRDWAKDFDFGIVSGLYRKGGTENCIKDLEQSAKKEGREVNPSDVEKCKNIPENPYENEYIEGTDPRVWYMAQEYKNGPWKKVIFDDIGNGILKYVPNVKNILLHAPISILMQNIDERNKEGKQPRKHEDVLGHYLEKYEATKNKPNDEVGHSVPVTKKDLEDKLLSSGVSEEFTKEFFNKLGMDSNGKYYIKIRDEYLKPGVQLINVDSKRTEYLNKFKSIIDGFK